MDPIDGARDLAGRVGSQAARAGLHGATVGLRATQRLLSRLGDGDVAALREEPDGEPFEVVRSDGAVIRGTVSGPADGHTVVLTHGYGLTRASWNPVASELVERGARVVRFDWRAHGASDIGDAPVVTGVLVADLRAVLEQLQVEDALLVAHSTGGYVALAALVDDPQIAQRFRGLVLVASLAGELLRDPTEDGMHLLRKSVLDRIVRNESLRLLLAGFAQGADISSAVSEELLDEFTSADHGALVTLLKDLAGRSYYDELGDIELQAVVVCGSADLTTPPSHAEAIADGLQRAEVVTIDDASHLLNWECPDRVIDLVVQLLDGEGSGAAAEGGESDHARGASQEGTTRRAVAILNPASGVHDPDETQDTIETGLVDAGFDVEVRRTEGEGDARRWAGEAAESAADLILVAGGDGTVREGLEGVTASDGDVPVAIVPMGTANLLARALGVPLDDVGAAVGLCEERATRRLDLIELVGRERHAMLMVDAGFDAELVRDASRTLKNRFGALAYVLAGLKNTIGLDTVDLALEIDGQLRPSSGHSVLCLNVGRIGESFIVDEEIEPDDGLLHVGLVSSPSPAGVLTTAAGMGLLGRDAQPNVEWVSCQRLRLVADPPLALQVDGDPAGETPVELRLVPSAVAVVVPSSD